MERGNKIACVTGASGMIGSRIASLLVSKGFAVRALSRSAGFKDKNIELFVGDIENEENLKDFLKDAQLLFHCAAELKDQTKMWKINVDGTKRLLRLADSTSIEYFCYISSAGVVGRTSCKWVNEETDCKPQSVYEQSKWFAEQIVSQGIKGCRVIILRPTNVIDNKHPGALCLPMSNSWFNRVKVFIKGGESAHIVHAEDVATAAVHFISKTINTPQCYFVSCDHEPVNTFGGLWALYRAIRNNSTTDNLRQPLHLPIIVPHILRTLWRGRGNKGDIKYSSEKLINEGFNFPLGVKGSIEQIISTVGSE